MHTPAIYEVTITHRVELPERGSYDYKTYLEFAVEYLNFDDTLHDGYDDATDQAVAEAMVQHYVEQRHNATAAHYIHTEGQVPVGRLDTPADSRSFGQQAYDYMAAVRAGQ